MRAAGHSALRSLGVALLLFGGAIHTWLAYEGYGTSELETVFLLNGIGSAVLAVGILRTDGPLAPLFGLGISAASLLAFALSRVGDGVIGFRATGFDPMPEAPLTLIVEGAALVVLATVVAFERQPLVEALKDAAGRLGQETSRVDRQP